MTERGTDASNCCSNLKEQMLRRQFLQDRWRVGIIVMLLDAPTLASCPRITSATVCRRG